MCTTVLKAKRKCAKALKVECTKMHKAKCAKIPKEKCAKKRMRSNETNEWLRSKYVEYIEY
jgi:hypothetical protein